MSTSPTIAELVAVIRAEGAEVTINKIKETERAGNSMGDAFVGAGKKGGRSLKSLALSAAKLAGAMYTVKKAVDFVSESMFLAARNETLGVVVQAVGRNAGYSKEQMDEFVKSVAAMGITLQSAQDAVIRMAQAQTDLTKASKLARIAQDAAVIGGINSSEALTRMVYGLQSAQVEVLRTIGINVNFQNSYKKLAKELNKNVLDLTNSEKATARLNAVMEAGKLITGTYADAMETAGKQMTSIPRYISDIQQNIGTVFTPALTFAVFTFSDALKDTNASLNELKNDGSLKQWGIEVANTLADTLDFIVNATSGFRLLARGIADIPYAWEAVKSKKGFEAFKKRVAETDKFVHNLWERLKDPSGPGSFRDQLEKARRTVYFFGRDAEGNAVKLKKVFEDVASAEDFRSAIQFKKDAEAKLLSGQRKRAEAEKPNHEARMRAFESENDQFQKQADIMERQVALLGVTTERERVLAEIQHGKYTNLSETQQEWLLSLADETDAYNAQKQSIAEQVQLFQQLNEVRSLGPQPSSLETVDNNALDYQLVNENALDEGLITYQEYYDNLVLIEEDAARKRAKIEENVQNTVTGYRMAAVQQGIGLLQLYAGKSKAAARLAIALEKSLAIANVIINTRAAEAKVTGQLGIYAGPAIAAIEAAEKVQIGIIAATGLVQAARAGQSSGGGGGVGGAGSAPPTNLAPPIAQTPEQQPQGQITIVLDGNFYGWDDEVIDQIVAGISDAVDNRDVRLISPESRNGQDLLGAQL